MRNEDRLKGLREELRQAKVLGNDETVAAVESQISELESKVETEDRPDDKTYRPSKVFRGAWEEAPVDQKRLDQVDNPDNVLAKKTGELEAAAMSVSDKVSHEGGDLPALNDTPSAEEVDEGGRASTVEESREVEDTEPAAAPAEKSDAPVADESEEDDEAIAENDEGEPVLDAPAKRGPGRPKSTKK